MKSIKKVKNNWRQRKPRITVLNSVSNWKKRRVKSYVSLVLSLLAHRCRFSGTQSLESSKRHRSCSTREDLLDHQHQTTGSSSKRIQRTDHREESDHYSKWTRDQTTCDPNRTETKSNRSDEQETRESQGESGWYRIRTVGIGSVESSEVDHPDRQRDLRSRADLAERTERTGSFDQWERCAGERNRCDEIETHHSHVEKTSNRK